MDADDLGRETTYSPADLALGADLADAVNLGALMTWDNPLAEGRDYAPDDEPVHDAYGCDSPECVICDGTEEAWS